ncbi:MAG TPA: hypothetical protein VEJ86_06540, partial [Candidatus Binataceae bacterium]|nr:hypothetical protein [Candidatus Binataceae bacterium]
MPSRDLFDAIEFLEREADSILANFKRANRGVAEAQLRFEVMAHRSGSAVNGDPRSSDTTESAAFGVAVGFLDRGGAAGNGQTGAEIGRLALKPSKLVTAVRGALAEACVRARASAREQGALRASLGDGARGLVTGPLPPAPPIRERVDARFQLDPRTVDLDLLKREARESSRAVAGVGKQIVYNFVGALTELRRELFCNTEGSVISQAFAFSQGDCYVVAADGDGHQETYDTIGQQRGFECIVDGFQSELMPNPDLRTFSVELAREARELAAAPALKPPDHEVVVVTDPQFNALVAHEIVGHPSEADRALKMEA